jgi:hypothetical protein
MAISALIQEVVLMLRTLLCISFGVSCGASGACAQIAVTPPAATPTQAPNVANMAADTASRKAELAKISGLVGTWTGPGWRILPTGERIEYDQTVLVTSKIGGQAMMIEGNSVRRPPSGPQGAGSLAIVTWEPDQNRYAFRSFSGGRLTEADGALLSPDTFQWTVKGPPLGLRFTVKFGENQWSELGEVSRDGQKTWTVSYQLEMRKNPIPR